MIKFVKIVVLCILIVVVGFVMEIEANESSETHNSLEVKDKFIIAPLGFSDTGVLSLGVSMELTEEKTLYEWRGYIYPLYGYGLFSVIEPKSSEEVKVERFERLMPLMPHHLDVIITDNFEYPEPLLLRVVKDDGSPYVGCLDFTLIYDPKKFESPDSKLSPITLRSNTINVCNNAAR